MIKQRKSPYLCSPKNGRVAEWLGKGLQNLVQRFESARDLDKRNAQQWCCAFFMLMAMGID